MSSGMSISMFFGSGDISTQSGCWGRLLVVCTLGAFPLDLIVGEGLLVLVLVEYTGIPSYLVQAPWTTPDHPGQP